MESDHDHRGGVDGTDGHGHDDHGAWESTDSARTLGVVAGINFAGFLAELAGGLAFGSVALLSDAVHMLFDALAYVMAFVAAAAAERYEGSPEWSYGLHRLEPLAAFLNGALLLPMVVYIVYESARRFLSPVAVATGPTLAIAVGGLAINLVSVYVVQGGEMTLNERGAFYHLLGDAGGSVAVIVSVVAIHLTGLAVVDPIVAVLIAVLVLWSAAKLLRGSGAILLQKGPLSHGDVRSAIREVEGVEGVADLHTWQVCSHLTVATVHLHVSTDSLEAADDIRRRVHTRLADLGVSHATVELLYGGGDALAAHDH